MFRHVLTMPSRPAHRQRVLCGSAVAALICLGGSQAWAFGVSVKLACAKDYYAHCSQHPSSSPQARACMRNAGEKLTASCVRALIAAGEVSEKEVAQRSARAKQ